MGVGPDRQQRLDRSICCDDLAGEIGEDRRGGDDPKAAGRIRTAGLGRGAARRGDHHERRKQRRRPALTSTPHCVFPSSYL